MTLDSAPAVSLASGTYQARISLRGATLLGLTRDRLDVIAPAPSPEWASRGFFGHLLAPWPNRLGDGRYEFGGTPHQLEITEPARQTALHGLVNALDWTVEASSATEVELRCALRSPTGYPFDLDLVASYHLDDAGLAVSIEAVNAGGSAAPYGIGFHPYLTVGRRIDDCVLTLPTSSRLTTDDRGLPIGSTFVAGTPFDFRAGRLIGETQIDHCFGDLVEYAGQTRVSLVDPDSGRSASLTASESFHWLQVFTGDALGLGARESVAVEPMTCPPDAFRTGTDLVHLAPGERHRAAFTIN